MPSLIENKMLLQYLTGASQDIGAGNPLGTNTNAVTNQNIAAQNYAKLLSRLLSGGGKITMDGQNINIKAPQTAFGGQGGNDPSELAMPQENIGLRDPQTGSSGFDPGKVTPVSARPPVGPSNVPSSNNSVMKILLSGGVNPSSSPLDIPAADLAGLTTQDLAQAASLKLGQNQLERQKVNDVVDRRYKMALIRQMDMKSRAGLIEAMKVAPMEVPGVGKVPFETWKSLPNDVKAYAYYAFDAKNRIVQGHFPAGEEVLTFNEFISQADPASLEQYYNLSKEDPAFREFYFESKKAGATQINLGDKAAQQRQRAEIDRETWLNDPDGLPKVIRDIEGSKEYSRAVALSDEPDAPARLMAEKIHKSIQSSFPDSDVSVDWEEDGKTAVWTIMLPNGKVKRFKYGLR